MPTPLPDAAVITRTPDQPWCDLGEEVVVLRVRDGAYYRFDASGRSIWLLLEQPRSLDDLITALSAEFAGDPATVAADVRQFLGRCADIGLLTLAPADA